MLKILCIHGIGGHKEEDYNWREKWNRALNNNLSCKYNSEFWCYDRIYDKYSFTVEDVANIVKEISSKTNIYQFNLNSLSEDTFGMILKWLIHEKLRKELQNELKLVLTNYQPHVIIGHSFGSIIAYQTLLETNVDLYFISIGSQIGHNVIKLYVNEPQIPESVRKWYHLYNPFDIVFTEPINIKSRSFKQIETKFFIDFHDPFNYLNDSNTIPMWEYIQKNYNSLGLMEKFIKLWDSI